MVLISAGSGLNLLNNLIRHSLCIFPVRANGRQGFSLILLLNLLLPIFTLHLFITCFCILSNSGYGNIRTYVCLTDRLSPNHFIISLLPFFNYWPSTILSHFKTWCLCSFFVSNINELLSEKTHL